jgi:hypothetical protein
MQREIQFDKLSHFLEELKRLGVNKIAFTEINEKRALEVAPDTLQVGDLIKLELLAYKDSTIYKCTMMYADFEEIHERLLREDFETVRRNRNIT